MAEGRLLRDSTREGRSGWKSAGLFDNADDVVAAFAALAARPDVDPERIFFVGDSEGAVLVTIAAARLLTAPSGAGRRGRCCWPAPPGPAPAMLRWQAAALAPTLPAPVRGLLRLLRTDLVRRESRNHDKL